MSDIPESPDSLIIGVDSTISQVTLQWNNPVFTTQGTPIDTLGYIHIFRNGELIGQVRSGVNEDQLFTDYLPRPDFYRYELCAEDTSGNMGRPLYTAEMWLGGPITGVVIWELDPTPITAAAIEASLDSLNYQGNIYCSDIPGRYPLEGSLDAVFVTLGIHPNNHMLTDQEGAILKSYLLGGGNLYMEGGDTWYFDPPTPVHTYFNLNALADGSNDLFAVNGEPGSMFNLFSFPYIGENSYIDEIEPTGFSTRILYNPSDNKGCGVACPGDGYRTIGTSFEFGGLMDQPPISTRKNLMEKYLEFFGLFVTGTNEDNNITMIPSQFKLHQNYPNPFNPTTTINWQLPGKRHVTLEIFNLQGQCVSVPVDREQSAGSHSLEFDASKLASGVYMYRLKAGNFSETRKMILMK